MNAPSTARDTASDSINTICIQLAGEVELKVPKLKGIPFETAIIERYRRREASVEEGQSEAEVVTAVSRRTMFEWKNFNIYEKKGRKKHGNFKN